MDCARVDGELVAFQLAVLDGATRAAVETHLLGCTRCVSAYLALKRAMDAGDEAAAPSELARARVRAEAQKLLAPVEPAPPTAERRRPTDRKKRATWAIVATAAAAMIAAPLVYRATRTTPSPSTGTAPAATVPGLVPVSTDQTVDTARTTPENLAFL